MDEYWFWGVGPRGAGGELYATADAPPLNKSRDQIVFETFERGFKHDPDFREVGSAADILHSAAALVSGPRDRQHGAKHQNFQNIADAWNAHLGGQLEWPLTAAQVGDLMALLKIARTKSGEHNLDDYKDAAGYIACAGEIRSASDGR